ncbi:MAG: hypothetical protein Kow0068_22570 [Marinilabiliales bacterium]
MKYRILTIIVILTTVILYGELVLKNQNNNKRKKYEDFLIREYQKISLYDDDTINAPKADRPDLAAIQNYYMTIDPYLKRVPVERLNKAYNDLLEIKQKMNKEKTLNWQEINSNMGGRTRALMWDPNDVNGKKVWTGSVTGGLWYINDIASSSSSWIPVSDSWNNLSISCITYDPLNTNIFYAGTGESQTAITIYRESSGRGGGIWKSSDGGVTWNVLPSTLNFAYVNDIVIRNENGNSVIYAAVVSGTYKGSVHQSLPTDGLYRSVDGGNSWTQVLPNIPNESEPYAPSDLAITADGRLFAGTTANLNGKGGGTILYSDSGVLGSWTIYEDYKTIIEGASDYNLPGRVILATAPSNANVVYAIIAAGSNTITDEGFSTYIGKYIIKTQDKGQTWTTVNTPPDDYGKNWAYLAWHALTIAVDPNQENNVFIGGLDLHKSTDGGNSWTKLSDWTLMYYGGGDEYVHADQHCIKFKPGSSSEAVFGCDGGVFYTSSANQSQPVFIEKNNSYNTLQFYTCDISPTAGSNAYLGGLQDNGTLLYQGNPLSPADMISGGDGAFCFFDEDQNDLFLTSYYDNQYYAIYGGGQYEIIDQFYCGLFINPSDYDSQNNYLYCNAMDVEGNYQDQLVRITGIPNTINGSFIQLNTGSTVPYSHLKLSPNNNNVLFIGTQSGRLFKVTNANTTPVVSEIGSISFPPGNISCIAIGGSDDTLLVTFSNYGIPSVWYSDNGGNSWTDKSGNLPDMPVRWAIFHPYNSEQAMLATEIGILSTNELRQSTTHWYPANTNLPNVRIDMLQIRKSDNKVLAATHGRGLFTTTFLYDPYTGKDNIGTEKPGIAVYPNPTSGNVIISDNKNMINKVIVNDIQGKTIFFKDNIGQSQLTVNLSNNSKGIYFFTIFSGNNKILEKVVLQ